MRFRFPRKSHVYWIRQAESGSSCRERGAEEEEFTRFSKKKNLLKQSNRNTVWVVLQRSRWQAEQVSCCHGKKYWDVHPWEQKRIFYYKITVLYIFHIFFNNIET